MPARKARLSRMEGARYRAALQELQGAGLEVTIPEELLENSDALDIVLAPRHENFLWELPNGCTCCAIFARLLGRRGGLILEDFVIASEWGSDLIPLSAKEKSPYRVPDGFSFSWDEVLNHRFENGLRFRRRGYLAQGWLLAVSYKPIFGKYPDRMPVTLSVIFTDQFGDPHCARAEAILERSAPRVDFTKRPKEFSGLFGPGSREPETRVYQTIANTLESPTKPDQGCVDETPSWVKELAVERKQSDIV